MSTFTSRLNLKRNDSSDPFELDDFIANWNILEAAPGSYVCTSSSRPSWGAAQAGRKILETDTLAELHWTGTAWEYVLSGTSAWMGVVAPNASFPQGTVGTYTLGTINTRRPGALSVMSFIRVSAPANAAVNRDYHMVGDILIDGTIRSLTFGYTSWGGTGSASTSAQHQYICVMGSAAVAAGAHTLQVRVTNGSTIAGSLFLGTIATSTFLTTQSGT